MQEQRSVKNLVHHLENVYSLPSTKMKNQEVDEQSIKAQLSELRGPWKASGKVHQGFQVERLPAGELDNWQILRVNMSKRSYVYPKKYKGMKIDGFGRQFSNYSGRDKDGKIPYLYESDIQKIQKLRSKIYTKPFKTLNKVRNDVFGFPRKLYQKSKRPISLKNGQKLQKIYS